MCLPLGPGQSNDNGMRSAVAHRLAIPTTSMIVLLALNLRISLTVMSETGTRTVASENTPRRTPDTLSPATICG